MDGAAYEVVDDINSSLASLILLLPPSSLTTGPMMRLRSSGGMAADMARKLEEIRQMNKKNYQKQRQQEEEEGKRQKDEEAAACAARGAQEEVYPDPLKATEGAISNFLTNVHNIMNGVQDMETNDTAVDDMDNVRSPVKKRQGSQQDLTKERQCSSSHTHQGMYYNLVIGPDGHRSR